MMYFRKTIISLSVALLTVCACSASGPGERPLAAEPTDSGARAPAAKTDPVLPTPVAQPAAGAAGEKPVLRQPVAATEPQKAPKPQKTWQTAKPVATQTLAEGGMHDMQNQAVVVLQNPTEALAGFPVDRREAVDWAEAYRRGLIAPRADVTGEGEMVTMDLDILMRDTRAMPHVRFPHLLHSQLLDCSNCHDAIFIPQDNANPVDMTKILRGEYCGVCHGRVAFSSFVCERCHNTPQQGQQQWWDAKK